MTKVCDVINLINDKFPFNLAMDWDNVGLIVGDKEKNIKNVLITLDVDEQVLEEAMELSCDLIISHHPLMFRSIRQIISTSPEQRTIMKLITSDTALVSAHTNLDAAKDGLNEYLALKLGLSDLSVLQKNETDPALGFGRIGHLDQPLTLLHFFEHLSETLDISSVRYAGDENKIIKKVAVNCGGGSDALYDAVKMGADVFVTGDVKYNQFRDAKDYGIVLIDAGHYETEHIVLDIFENILKDSFPDVEVFRSKANTPVIKYYNK